jgi:uncharacterized protein (TIGR03790 family)
VKRRAGQLLALLFCFAVARAADDTPALRVVLLANSEDPDSLRIAEHYAEKRGVPRENIIALPLPIAETISWREFVVTLWDPLMEKLTRAKWLDAVPMALTDPVGRKKYSVYAHRMTALVVCRGVPLRIDHDPSLYADSPFTQRAEFRTNAGAVDAELTMVAHPNYPINSFVPNPLFQNENVIAAERAQIVKVARLDGPTLDDALALVDRAMAVERTGLLGRAYVDIGGLHAIGDKWLEGVVTQLDDFGFAPVVDRNPATMPATARCDAPAIYFGWYAGSINGPFALPGFQFPPGAIAFHIHSYSAATLRSPSSGWTGPLVARGATATVGNVFEPYLELTHRPNLFLRALTRGATLAEAAFFSLPELSWQAILVGDPLYRPFAVSHEVQLKNLATLPPRLAGYAVLRRLGELDIAEQREEAIRLAREAQRDVPSLAVGLALSRLLSDAGERESAASALGFAALLKSFRADEWALAREVALALGELGRTTRAFELWQTLLGIEALPRELRVAWLAEAAKAARAAKNFPQATKWETSLAELTSPPQIK